VRVVCSLLPPPPPQPPPPPAALLPDGRAVVAARGGDHVPAVLVEVAPGGAWESWQPLPGVAARSQPALAVPPGGLLEVYVRGDGGALHRAVQAVQAVQAGGPGSGDAGAAGQAAAPVGFGPWERPGGTLALATEPVPVVLPDGRVDVFAVQAPSGAANDPNRSRGPVVHLAQTAPGGPWAAWTPAGPGPPGAGDLATATPAVAVDPDGTTHVLARDPDGHPRRTVRGPDGSWSGWRPLGDADPGAGLTVLSGPAVARRPDGDLEVAAWGGDDTAHRLQAPAGRPGGGADGGWTVLAPSATGPDGVSTFLAAPPALGVRADGGLVAAMRSASGHLCVAWTAPDGAWSGWTPVPPAPPAPAGAPP
jgi:hypothetical protein